MKTGCCPKRIGIQSPAANAFSFIPSLLSELEAGLLSSMMIICLSPGFIDIYENQVITIANLTTDNFDALTVDHTTVTFEGASETLLDHKTG